MGLLGLVVRLDPLHLLGLCFLGGQLRLAVLQLQEDLEVLWLLQGQLGLCRLCRL
jgi:hypothetical protein